MLYLLKLSQVSCQQILRADNRLDNLGYVANIFAQIKKSNRGSGSVLGTWVVLNPRYNLTEYAASNWWWWWWCLSGTDESFHISTFETLV